MAFGVCLSLPKFKYFILSFYLMLIFLIELNFRMPQLGHGDGLGWAHNELPAV
jgi:hypothetical protein